MIRGVHTMFYSSEPDALRAFLRDKLGFPFSDVGGGWLIFDLPEADMGCHPADPEHGAPSGKHDISFYGDDLQTERPARGFLKPAGAELHATGWRIADGITEQIREQPPQTDPVGGHL